MTDPDGLTKCVGIIGDPVAHSLSPKMHNAAFAAVGLNWRYLAFRVPAGALPQALRGVAALDFSGVNVTVPHKEAAASLMDELDRVAERIGAVNTVRVIEGRLQGFNTDAAGLLDALAHDGQTPVAGKRCLVIGAGGGGRAAAFALAGASAASVVILNRTESRARGLAGVVRPAAPDCKVSAGPLTPDAVEAAMEDAQVVVQATTATMSSAMGGPFDNAQGRRGGRADWLPALQRRFRREMTVVEMVYAPTQTELLSAARAAGAVAVSGLSMLVFQGARSFELWTGRPAPIDAMRRAIGM